MAEAEMSIKEWFFWWKVGKQRKICNKAITPEMAVHIAAPFDKPYFLCEWWDRMNETQKRELLQHVWLSQGSSAWFGYDWWLPKFEEIGFYSNCGIEKPIEPVILYRGAEPAYHRGMAWTPDVEVAKIFAARDKTADEKRIFKMTVPPEFILAIFSGGVDSSHCEGKEKITSVIEYVLDYRELNPDYITDVTDSF